MFSLYPRRGAAYLASRAKLNAHQTWVLQVLEPWWLKAGTHWHPLAPLVPVS